MRAPNQNPELLASTIGAYGPGYYFTDMHPGYPRHHLARTLWYGPNWKSNLPKTEYFLELSFHGNTSIWQAEARPHVFLVLPTTTARPQLMSHGPHPEARMGF